MIAEIRALDRGTFAIRIPDQQQVPITPRVQRLVDTSQFQRLRKISQLGLVSLVYPGATHSRFEHCLGVYRMSLLFLRHFSLDEQFANIVSESDARLFVVSALLHDLAHWPYCHPIEDLELDSIQEHEALFENLVRESDIPDLLRTDWGIDVKDVANLLNGNVQTQSHELLKSMLSGPIDVDKMDYLHRDSLHAGVPYGQNFDRQRLIGSLCLNEKGNGISITDKGRTAAELMVFARYVMFSEVYWHHAVRGATAMLQRAFFQLKDDLDLNHVVTANESQWTESLLHSAKLQADGMAAQILVRLFSDQRRLYKRLGQYSCFENEEVYRQLAQRPYHWLVKLSNRLAEIISAEFGVKLNCGDVLIDAPPVGLEVQFNINVKLPKANQQRPLGELSPVVKALATNQFDDYVKRVRVFVKPEFNKIDQARTNLDRLLVKAISELE